MAPAVRGRSRQSAVVFVVTSSVVGQRSSVVLRSAVVGLPSSVVWLTLDFGHWTLDNAAMTHLKPRILAVILILASAGLIYYNWQQLLHEGKYSFKLASFGPVVGVGGLFLLLFPARAGKPDTTKDKIIVLLVLVIGLAAGLVNWYLMDPGFFGR